MCIRDRSDTPRLQALTGQGYGSTGKPRIAWDDHQARDELVTALVNDALALLAGLDTEAITAQGLSLIHI